MIAGTPRSRRGRRRLRKPNSSRHFRPRHGKSVTDVQQGMAGRANSFHRRPPLQTEVRVRGVRLPGWLEGWDGRPAGSGMGRRRLKPAGGKVGDDLSGNKNSCVSRLGGLGQGRERAKGPCPRPRPFEDSVGEASSLASRQTCDPSGAMEKERMSNDLPFPRRS